MLTSFLEVALDWAVRICECIAAIVILISVGTAFFYYIRNLFTPAERDVKIDLMSGMSLGIEFAMAAEILKTLEKHDVETLMLLGGVILIRVILALMISYELKKTDHEEKIKEAKKTGKATGEKETASPEKKTGE